MTTSALKDHLDPAAVRLLGSQLAHVFPQFDVVGFERAALASLPDLSLTGRVSLLKDLLKQSLAPDLSRDAASLRQLVNQWPAENNRGWDNYAVWPLIEMIGECGRDDPPQALALLADFTHLFTAEFAMRWYVRERLTQVQPLILQWTASESSHIRRLASECLRPRLPWGGHIKALQRDPAPILSVLEKLKDDPSLYVQKSVGNNLNDISKDHSTLVLKITGRWLCDATLARQQVIKRALRTLIKQGEPAVFPLLGFSDKPAVNTDFDIPPASIRLGESVQLQLKLTSAAMESQRLNIDYRLTMPGIGNQQRFKVFKWTTLQLPAGETRILQKTQRFSTLSTRRYYPGKYTLDILINGIAHAQASLQLIAD